MSKWRTGQRFRWRLHLPTFYGIALGYGNRLRKSARLRIILQWQSTELSRLVLYFPGNDAWTNQL